MDAIAILTDQHRKLEGLLKNALGTRQPRARAAAVIIVGDDLTKHVTSEEEVFYPAVKSKGTENILLESLEEHLSLKRLLADLLTLDMDAETFEAKLKVLKEQVEHHHKEEEEKLFPKVRKVFENGELDVLGQRILALQQQLHLAGAPHEAVLEQTNNAAPLR